MVWGLLRQSHLVLGCCVSLPWGLLHVAVDVDTEYKKEWAICLGPAHGDLSTHTAGRWGQDSAPPYLRRAPCQVTPYGSSLPSGLEMRVVLPGRGQF